MISFFVLANLLALGRYGVSGTSNPPSSITALTIGSSNRINVAYTDFVTDSNGKTLYIFNGDTPGSGVSTCTTTSCVALWPPLVLAAGQTSATFTANSVLSVAGAAVTATISSIARADGSKQVTLNGYPLYYFLHDANPGDVTCQGVSNSGDIWLLISPAGKPITTMVPGTGVTGGALTVPTGNAGLSSRKFVTSTFTDYLVDVQGYAYYAFGIDVKNAQASNCTAACAGVWPPASLPAGDTVAPAGTNTGVVAPTQGNIGQFNRNLDGVAVQLTYGGYPLYYFVHDSIAGDINCQGVTNSGGPWWLVGPSGSLNQAVAPVYDSTKTVTVTLKTAAVHSAGERTAVSMLVIVAVVALSLVAL